jgi:hypothetical protein
MPARDDLRWNHFFDELKEFERRHGQAEVPRFLERNSRFGRVVFCGGVVLAVRTRKKLGERRA